MNKEIIEDLDAAAAVYRFLAHFFLKEPTPEELKNLSEGTISELLKEMNYDFLKDIRDQSYEEQADLLAEEYCRLFIGPGPHLSPHEAILRGEGKHWGEFTVAVNNAYKETGFEIADDIKEMPDHIGIELEFVATLYEQEISLLKGKSKANVKIVAIRSARELFLKEHLGNWTGNLLREIDKRSKVDFYKSLASLAEEWVQNEIGTHLESSSNITVKHNKKKEVF